MFSLSMHVLFFFFYLHTIQLIVDRIKITTTTTTSISNTWYLIIVSNMNQITTFFSQISQEILKIHEEKVAIITQMLLIMVPNMKKIHPATMEECVRTDRPGPFLYSPIPLLQSEE